ncbi:MAG: sigma-70 family RNA polymerase sigma factor [Gemmataceae bacterium]|nr:sigma-70 family RNA polymerase sigma factor [Gemmataceae bacterium]MDW8265176.1 sigma-70 family RNA polymerase sigma factor [Gemmataceae bacterium]
MTLTTRSSLLGQLREDDEEVWSEFCRFYTPYLIRVAGRLGLRGQDVDDMVQGVLVDLYQCRAEFRYDRATGRFRHYLKKAAIARLAKWLRAARRAGNLTKDPPERTVDDYERVWEAEYRQHILREALARVRQEVEPKTYQAFDLYALQGVKPGKVARFLGISKAAVYTYKARVVERLRAIVQELTAD